MADVPTEKTVAPGEELEAMHMTREHASPPGRVHTLSLLGCPSSALPRKEVYSPFLMASLLLT